MPLEIGVPISDVTRRPPYCGQYALPHRFCFATVLGQIVDLDPGFAQAHAEISKVHSMLYHFGHDRSGPTLPEDHVGEDTEYRLTCPSLPTGEGLT